MSHLNHQKGVIIVVALIMLLVMTGVGVTVMSGATLQERMAGNSRQLLIARANAESALREAEFALNSLDTTGLENFISLFDSSSTTKEEGYYIDVPTGHFSALVQASNPTPSGFAALASSDWPSDTSLSQAVVKTLSKSDSPASSQSGTAARYIIEYIGSRTTTLQNINLGASTAEATPSFIFRITAIGYGANTKISSVLQSIYSTGLGST